MTTILNPGDARIQAVFVRGHCRLMAKGMSARGVRKGDVLKRAGAITGKTYKRGEFNLAAEDLTSKIEEWKKS